MTRINAAGNARSNDTQRSVNGSKVCSTSWASRSRDHLVPARGSACGKSAPTEGDLGSAPAAPDGGSAYGHRISARSEPRRENAGVFVERLPGWVRPWCSYHLGAEPVEVLFAQEQMSTVLGLELSSGARVVVKAREREERAISCVAAQRQLVANGFPCPMPLTDAVFEDALVVHAEQYCPGGVVRGGDSIEAALRAGRTFAWLMTALTFVSVDPVLTIHDWDSLAWQPEAALAGAASGSFHRGVGQPPALPSIASSEAFLSAYQDARGQRFSSDETQIAWAASVWTTAHNARWEALLSDNVSAVKGSLARQAEQRLRKSGA